MTDLTLGKTMLQEALKKGGEAFPQWKSSKSLSGCL